MKTLFRALVVGFSITFAASVTSAQDTQTTIQNPFGQGAQAGTAKAAEKKKTRVAETPAAGQFASEAEAKASCPGDTVVWVNTNSKIYHHAGAKTYGTTKRGVYMCEKNTAAAGFRAAKNEKRK
jgi:plastocyanin